MGKNLAAIFRKNALKVSAFVHETAGIREALVKSVEICLKAPECEMLMPAEDSGDSRRILAAPGLGADEYAILDACCREKHIRVVRERLRRFPGGFDAGITLVDAGIAETGTLVVNSDSEDIRLASMLCETHIAILDRSDIRVSALEMADELGAMMNSCGSYTSFITGASRTADIERVLALGVHGPLALHIVLKGSM